MDTEDYLESSLKNLSQDTFVKGFDTSQAKIEDPLDRLESGTSLKMSTTELDD